MGLLDSILGADGGKAIGQIAKQLGVPDSVAQQAASVLSPALGRGIERNAQSEGGLDSLLDALKTGNHQKYVDDPEVLTKPESIDDGNAILGHILGSKDVSRNVAGAASNKTGIDPSVLKKMLPMLASLVMGQLSKQSNGGQNLSGLLGDNSNPTDALSALGGGNALAMLKQYLDADKDGDATDELLDLAKKYF